MFVCFCSSTVLTSNIITEIIENHSEFSVCQNSCNKFVSRRSWSTMKLSKLLIWKAVDGGGAGVASAFACSYIYLKRHLPLPEKAPSVAFLLKEQSGQCPRHAFILRRPCANYSSSTLSTRCCRLQCESNRSERMRLGWQTPRVESLKLAKLYKNWECVWSRLRKKIFVFYYVTVVCSYIY